MDCYSFTEFTKLISNLPKLLNFTDFNESSPMYSKLIDSVLFRMRSSLLIPKDLDGSVLTDKTLSKSSPKTQTTASRYSIINSFRRQFPGINASSVGSFFNRFYSSTANPVVTTAQNATSPLLVSSTGQSTSTNESNQVGTVLPNPPEPPLIATNLFVMIQRLADLSQPKSVDSLIQRPAFGMRAPVAIPEQLSMLFYVVLNH